MPFAIMLMPADLEAPPPAYEAAIEAAVRANGGAIGPGRAVRFADGGAFTFKADDVRADRLSPAACRAIFDAAVRANAYVDTEGSDVARLRVKGTTLETPPEMGRARVVANPRVLCAKLKGRVARWTREMGRLRAAGVIGPDNQPLEPPAAPGAEPRLAKDPSGVAARCEALSRKMAAELGWKFVRGLATQNAQWGVVWRADIAPEADPSTWTRDVCWGARIAGAKGRIGLSTRPLRMFDDSKSIGPLPADEALREQ